MTTQLEDSPQVLRARARVGMVLQEKWTLESLLGIGGMAAVYAAKHRNGKRVAIKVLHAEFSHDDQVRSRFLREGYAANGIHHEGAVSILDDDIAPDGSAFLVMELLEGETVERRWERSGRRLPPTEVLLVTDQLLDVLVAAHARNVVHRDLKPENLFLTEGGTLKVLDFGIAKTFDSQQPHGRAPRTHAGTVMGTPAFMAPEQARGRADQIDARTDLWAVGATMFTLLSGRYVHAADSPQEQLISSATAPAPSLSTVAPEAGPHLAAIVDRALAFDRADRWPDAAAMQRAVRAALEESGAAASSAATGTAARVSRTTLRTDPSAGAPLATLPSGPRGSAAVAVAATAIDGRTRELARLRGSQADLQRRYGLAKKAVAEARQRVDEARAERNELEQWFHRRVGRRAMAVEEAQADARRQLVELGRRAVADREAFDAGLDPLRAQVAKLESAARAAEHDVRVHAAAVDAHDPRAFRSGLVVLTLAAVLALGLLFAPIAWRAVRVVEPPAPRHVEPGR